MQSVKNSITSPPVAVSDISAQMRAREHAAYEREVDASIRRGLSQANDPTPRKHTLNEMHAHVSKTIVRRAREVTHA